MTSITEKVGPEGRYLHKGMTSSDVLDTCFNIQLLQSGKIILRDIEEILTTHINPIYGYICGLRHSDKNKEINFIKKYLNISKFSKQLVCVLVCRENDKMKFIPIFANNIENQIKEEFTEIFS